MNFLLYNQIIVCLSFLFFYLQKQVRDVCVIISGGTVCFSCISLYQGNEKFYKQFVMPAVQILNPETAHKIGVALAKYHFFQKPKTPDPPILVSSYLCFSVSRNPKYSTHLLYQYSTILLLIYFIILYINGLFFFF